MTVYGVILMTMLTHSAYKGSKVLISLYALELGAQPWMIGFLFLMYAVFPICCRYTRANSLIVSVCAF